MKLILLRDARIWHKAGETVEVGQAEAGFLLSVGSAVQAPKNEPKQPTPRKGSKK